MVAAAGGAGLMRSRAPASDAGPAPASVATAPPRLERFEDLVALAAAKRELKLKHALEHVVRVIRFEPGQVEIALTPEADPRLAGELTAKLEEWTGRRWMVAVGADVARPTLAEEKRDAQARLLSDARADPVVAAVLARFPGAEIVDVRVRAGEAEATMPPAAIGTVADSGPGDDGEWELEP
jgi:DNA polymerase-3 subunit gamma/tau